MKHLTLIAATALPLMLLPACQPTGDSGNEAASLDNEAVISDAAEALPTPQSEPGAPEAIADDGIALKPVTREDIFANSLDGELGCSFTATGGSAQLLVAMGGVQTGTRIYGLVKPGGALARVEAAGDFDALTRGLTLNGEGIDVTVTRGASQNSQTEETRHDATLRVAREDGARHTYAGTWTCGP